MEKQEFVSKRTGRNVTRYLPTLSEVKEADDNMCGFCLACGFMQDGCEPDARCYICEDCGKRTVFGAQELALMGLVSTQAD